MLLQPVMLMMAADLTVHAADLDREARIRAQISDAILDGEPRELTAADGQRFLAIYTEAEETPARGTAIILHGRGLHPDWINVVHPLRVGLTRHGWNTLALQLPVLDVDATFYDYMEVFPQAIPRIEAAIDAAREESDGKLVVIAHSCGAHMAQHWINRRGGQAVAQLDGFVGIGMGATDYGQPMREPFALDAIGAPVLDVYAENDYPAVRRLAGERLALMQSAGNPASAQVVVPDAEHYFVDRGDALLEVVAGWLDGMAAAASTTVNPPASTPGPDRP